MLDLFVSALLVLLGCCVKLTSMNVKTAHAGMEELAVMLLTVLYVAVLWISLAQHVKQKCFSVIRIRVSMGQLVTKSLVDFLAPVQQDLLGLTAVKTLMSAYSIPASIMPPAQTLLAHLSACVNQTLRGNCVRSKQTFALMLRVVMEHVSQSAGALSASAMQVSLVHCAIKTSMPVIPTHV